MARGGSRRRNSRNPDEVGDPPNWSNLTFLGVPPRNRVLTPETHEIWSNSRFPGFTYVGGVPPGRGGYPPGGGGNPAKLGGRADFT